MLLRSTGAWSAWPAPLLLAGGSLALVTAAASGWVILNQPLTTLGIAGILVGALGSVALAYVSDKVATHE